VKGGEQDAIWNGAPWLGVHDTLRLPLRWPAIPNMALVGWYKRGLGSRTELAFDGTLSVPVVVRLVKRLCLRR